MDNDTLIFGKLSIPFDSTTSTATFSAPANLSQEAMEQTSFGEIGKLDDLEKAASAFAEFEKKLKGLKQEPKA